MPANWKTFPAPAWLCKPIENSVVHAASQSGCPERGASSHLRPPLALRLQPIRIPVPDKTSQSACPPRNSSSQSGSPAFTFQPLSDCQPSPGTSSQSQPPVASAAVTGAESVGSRVRGGGAAGGGGHGRYPRRGPQLLEGDAVAAGRRAEPRGARDSGAPDGAQVGAGEKCGGLLSA